MRIRRRRRAGREVSNSLLTKIMRSDKRIRYCAAIDQEGREIIGGMRPGVKSLESGVETNRLRMQHAVGQAMAEGWNRFHGRMDYVIVHRRKVMLLMFPLSGRKSILLSTEPDYPLQRFRKIVELVNTFPESEGDRRRAKN